MTLSKKSTIGIYATNLRPADEHPQSLKLVTRWFYDADFEEISVRRGLYGVVGSDRRPVQ